MHNRPSTKNQPSAALPLSTVLKTNSLYGFLWSAWQKSKPVPKNPLKAKSIIPAAEYRDEKNNVLGEIKYADDFPVIKFNTANPILQARVRGKLMGNICVRFSLDYLQFLSPAARIHPGPIYRDPMKFVARKIKERGLDLTSALEEIHEMLKAANAVIAEHNRTASNFLKINPLTADDLQNLIAFCDVYKGLGGCTSAVISKKMIRNLDWLGLNVAAKQLFGELAPTGNTDADKPQANFIHSIPPFFATAAANDKGVVIALNEAARSSTTRTQNDSIPQLLLIRMAIKECSSMADIKKFLETHHAAACHIWTVIAPDGYGVFEHLPLQSPDEAFHFRGYLYATDNASKPIHATNHFLDEDNNFVPGSDGISCSRKRGDIIANALTGKEEQELTRDELVKIAAATEWFATIQTFFYEVINDEMTMAINNAENHSATAIAKKSDSKPTYSELNLTQLFKELLSGVQTDLLPLTPDVDNQLKQLLRASHTYGKNYPVLSSQLSALYSRLIFELATHSVPAIDKTNLTSEENIKKAGEKTLAIVKFTLSNDSYENKISQITAYKNEMQGILPKEKHSRMNKLLGLVLGMAIGILLFGTVIATFTGDPALMLEMLADALGMLLKTLQDCSFTTLFAGAAGTAAAAMVKRASSFSVPGLTLHSNNLSKTMLALAEAERAGELTNELATQRPS